MSGPHRFGTQSNVEGKPARSGPGRSARPHLIALLAYLLLALIATYPTILHFTTAVPGDLVADRDQNLWNLWWLKESLGHATNPFHTDLLYYPYGTNLYYHTLAIPLGLIGLLPQILFGLPAAYNSVILVAFTLSGYSAFRLALYAITREPNGERPQAVYLVAAFLGGVVFAFTPYTLDALKGQLEVLSLQWMPLYAETWLRAMADQQPASHKPRRWIYAFLAGLFLALAAYSSLYYAVYLAIFTLAHLVYRLLAAWRAKGDLRPTLPQDIRRSSLVAVLVAATTLILALPLAAGLLADHDNPRLAVTADPQHRLTHSADVLSFFAPPHDHLLFGTWQDQPGVNEPPIHDYVGLGYVALALAIIGAIAGRRTSGTKFWIGLGLIALLLALGPQLQVNRNLTGAPLPFALLEKLPGMDAIAKPERFVVLVRLCMAVLAATGVAWLLNRSASTGFAHTARVFNRRVALIGTLLLALLLLELPIHPRYTGPYSIPSGFDLLAQQPQGGLMELPFATQQVDIISQRMLYQTTHDKPIMAGYLSRNYNSPIIDSCSPFWGFISPLDVPQQDIASPLVVSRLQDVLSFYNISYIAIYTKNGGPDAAPVDPSLAAALQNIVRQVASAPPLYSDDYLTLSRVASATLDTAPPSFHIGDGWYNVERSDGTPFRWIKGGSATLCVFAPRKVTASLNLQATAFAQEQQLVVSTGSEQLFAGTLSPSAFAPISTQPIEWQPGITEVHITAGKPGVTPQSLDPASKDARPLTVGVRRASLVSDAQK